MSRFHKLCAFSTLAAFFFLMQSGWAAGSVCLDGISLRRANSPIDSVPGLSWADSPSIKLFDASYGWSSLSSARALSFASTIDKDDQVVVSVRLAFLADGPDPTVLENPSVELLAGRRAYASVLPPNPSGSDKVQVTVKADGKPHRFDFSATLDGRATKRFIEALTDGKAPAINPPAGWWCVPSTLQIPDAEAIVKYDALASSASPAVSKADIPGLFKYALMNVASAQYLTAIAIDKGLALSSDGSSSDWLSVAADNGCAPAQVRFGKALRDSSKAKEAAILFAKAADQGSAEAMVLLAEAYRAGSGIKRNASKAASLFIKAADLGSTDAQIWAAMCLLDGEGVAQDPARGVAYLKAAAATGSDQAQYLLGVCLFDGFGGTEKDPPRAFKCFQAASKSIDAAKIFVGYAYLKGVGIEKDQQLAYNAFADAGEAGSVAGCLWAAYCCANGLGVERNVDAARDWAEKAGPSPAARAYRHSLANLE